MNNVIVDTCVWIDFFRKKLITSSEDFVRDLLLNDQAAITDVILHELLIGSPTEKEYKILADLFSAMTCFSFDPSLHKDFSKFGWQIRRLGLTARYTDLTIAFLARVHHCAIFSLDKFFTKLAQTKLIQIVEL